MSFSELLPVADEVLKDFILHRSDVQSFDFRSSAPLMFEVSVEVHEEVMKSPFYGFLEALSKPVFTLSTSYNDDVRVGMGWVFETHDLLLDYPRGGGGVHEFHDLVSYQRSCVFKHNGKSQVLCTLPAADVSGRFHPFFHIVENDRRSNYQEIGMLDRVSGNKLFSIKQLATRPCELCTLRGEPCLCSNEMVSRGFLPGTDESSDGLIMAPDLDVAACQVARRRWMAGRFGFHVNGLPAFSVNAKLLSSGEMLERARIFLVQNQAQKSTSLCPISHSILQRAIMSVLEKKEQENAVSGDKDAERFKCDRCGASFTRIWSLRRHVAGVHEENRQFACELCSRTFKQSGHLQEHLRTNHSRNGGHSCEICRKRFGVKSKLERHMYQKHSNIRMYECELCLKKYKDAHGLKTHVKRKHSSTHKTTRVETF
ncbi:hypothetical protein NDN08_007247 [Rhodosorus marinus]|uniref:C2H2-type domain-containing protein n=1 Tax=Rhodosorus marinus TaxID=101924 RepID=A0AAV8UG09_9RHOD|nr:hypothetical protein NDN08_007247 [Rhodosorus marinus]